MGPFSVFTVFVVVIYVSGAVDKTSSSFLAHGKIGNFIIIIITDLQDETSRSLPRDRDQLRAQCSYRIWDYVYLYIIWINLSSTCDRHCGIRVLCISLIINYNCCIITVVLSGWCAGLLGCLNFLKLCKIKYYNFCLFHSVQVWTFLSDCSIYLASIDTAVMFCKLEGRLCFFVWFIDRCFFQSLFLHSHLSITQAHLVECDHSVFGSNWSSDGINTIRMWRYLSWSNIWQRTDLLEACEIICFYHMWQLRMMRKTLTTDAVRTLVQTLVTSRLDYCNNIFDLISAASLQAL